MGPKPQDPSNWQGARRYVKPEADRKVWVALWRFEAPGPIWGFGPGSLSGGLEGQGQTRSHSKHIKRPAYRKNTGRVPEEYRKSNMTLVKGPSETSGMTLQFYPHTGRIPEEYRKNTGREMKMRHDFNPLFLERHMGNSDRPKKHPKPSGNE